MAGQITAEIGRGLRAFVKFLTLGGTICSPYLKLAGALHVSLFNGGRISPLHKHSVLV